MKYRDIVGIAWRMLQTNWLRSTLTVLGIGVAISTIVVLVGFGYGVQNITIGSIMQSKSLLSLDIQTTPENVPPLDVEAVSEVKKLVGVADASPVYLLEGQFSSNGKLGSTSVKSGTESYLSMEGVKYAKGTGYRAGNKEVVLAPQTIEMLEASTEDILGKQVEVRLNNPNAPTAVIDLGSLTVVGITDGASPDNYVPSELLAGVTSLQPNMIKALASDRDSVLIAQSALSSKGYQVTSLINTLDQARQVFRWVTVGLVIIAAIALIVAAIGMFNTLTIALLERTREVGVMKAIGITNKSIRRLFLTESVLIGTFGGIAGLALGLGMSGIFGFFVNRLAAHYGTADLDIFQFTPFFLISMAIYPAILGLVTGIYPALRASRINPLVALRYE